MEKPGDSGFYSQWEVPVDVMYWVVRVGSEMLSGFILVVVGDGRRVYFWHDAWCRDWILFWRTLFQIALDCRRQRFFCALLFEFYGRCFGGGGGVRIRGTIIWFVLGMICKSYVLSCPVSGWLICFLVSLGIFVPYIPSLSNN